MGERSIRAASAKFLPRIGWPSGCLRGDEKWGGSGASYASAQEDESFVVHSACRLARGLVTVRSPMPGPIHAPQQNHLLAALSAAEQERLYPHLRLVPMSLGQGTLECGELSPPPFF